MLPEDTSLDDEIQHTLNRMSELDPGEQEYTEASQALRNLLEMRSKERAFPISPEVLVTLGMNLLSIILILRHEQFNVVTTRALQFLRPR